ncbi:8-amino-7-oxononanoate synthase [Uliginosibacterium sp. sgz301328]|uniref:8-amino-7-oxononanoate synthase n=1 Tax=Uliginosibacterium sp. sgz301328 TaxID=3243764 RepID=UPI00359D6563
MIPLLHELADQLAAHDDAALRRTRRVVDTPCGPEAIVDGRAMLAFASNDYLGLAGHPALADAASEGAKRWGVGAGASHLVSGHTSIHEELEQRLAAFVQMDAALAFCTGYMANIAVMPALLSRGDAIFADRLNHASLIDGAQLARADMHRYPHGDVDSLARLLEKTPTRRRMIVTDSVFSMDGDVAPLANLLELAERFDAWLLVDDAHGFGVLGPQGRGALAEAGLRSDRLILMGTLGKAAGVAGAFVAGAATLVEWLKQKSRAYIFTTAAPPLLAHTLMAALDLIEQGDALRAQLDALRRRLHDGVRLTRWRLLPSRTAIQPIVIGDNAETMQVARQLWDEGIWAPAIRPPTVPAGTARLRISLSAGHTEAHLDRLLEALHRCEAARA